MILGIFLRKDTSLSKLHAWHASVRFKVRSTLDRHTEKLSYVHTFGRAGPIMALCAGVAGPCVLQLPVVLRCGSDDGGEESAWRSYHFVPVALPLLDYLGPFFLLGLLQSALKVFLSLY